MAAPSILDLYKVESHNLELNLCSDFIVKHNDLTGLSYRMLLHQPVLSVSLNEFINIPFVIFLFLKIVVLSGFLNIKQTYGGRMSESF